MEEYVLPYFQEGDCVYISEKIVSLCQGDIIPKESVKLSWTAKFLSKFASTTTPPVLGVHNVYKMQVAILLCGKPKVIFAAIAAGVARLFGKRGVFYEITGPQVAGLDGFYAPILRTTKTSAFSPRKTRTRPPQGWRRRQAFTAASPTSTTLAGGAGGVAKVPMDKVLLQRLLKDNPAGNGHEDDALRAATAETAGVTLPGHRRLREGLAAGHGCSAGVQIHDLSWISHGFYTKEELRLLYRHEWKHPVTPEDMMALRARLGAVLQLYTGKTA